MRLACEHNNFEASDDAAFVFFYPSLFFVAVILKLNLSVTLDFVFIVLYMDRNSVF